METMNISLPPALKSFIDTQVRAGGFGTVSEYVRQLVREDRARKERDSIDRKLLEAIESGTTPLTPQDWQDLRKKLRRRAVKRTKPK
jgi:antitoxin ParD1/3/4